MPLQHFDRHLCRSEPNNDEAYTPNPEHHNIFHYDVESRLSIWPKQSQTTCWYAYYIPAMWLLIKGNTYRYNVQVGYTLFCCHSVSYQTNSVCQHLHVDSFPGSCKNDSCGYKIYATKAAAMWFMSQ